MWAGRVLSAKIKEAFPAWPYQADSIILPSVVWRWDNLMSCVAHCASASFASNGII
jgi:hypothetical protein